MVAVIDHLAGHAAVDADVLAGTLRTAGNDGYFILEIHIFAI